MTEDSDIVTADSGKEANFIAMIYLIGSPVGRLLDQAKST